MNRTSIHIKTLLSLFLFSLLGSPLVFGQAKGIWTGKKTTFTKSSYASWTTASNQDRITPAIWITRADDRGIFNIKVSSSYITNTSPKGTKWAFGTTSNLGSLNFNTWENAVNNNPPGMVNKDMVLFITSDSIYIDIKFISWASGGSGGGFSYIRSTDCRTEKTISTSICDSLISPSKKFVWKKTGTYYDTIPNKAGCDSLLTINLKIYDQDSGKKFMSGCGFAILPISKRKVTVTGTYYDTLVKGTICGRDSILVAVVYIHVVPTKSLIIEACDSFVSPSGKFVWKTSGDYTDILKAMATCDTVVSVALTINSSAINKVSEEVCDSFISASKRIYRQTGNYLDTLQTIKGCDSIIDLNLIVNKSTLTKLAPLTCNVSYPSPSGKYIWGKSGLYYDTLVTNKGCDSILELSLVVNPKRDSLIIKSCEPWTSPSTKYVFNQTGIYYDTLTTVELCDSVLKIDFTKTETSSASATILAAINKYHSPSGKYVWTTSGNYKDTIPNQSGCDSFISFNITIVKFSLDVTKSDNTLSAVATGINYQWLDCNDDYSEVNGASAQSFVVTKKGKYAVELSNEWNTDTSACIDMNLGLDRLVNPYEIRVYPNPSDGHFSVNLEKIYKEVESLELSNINGKMLFKNQNISEEMDLDIADAVTSGIYFIRVNAKDFSFVTPIVIQ